MIIKVGYIFGKEIVIVFDVVVLYFYNWMIYNYDFEGKMYMLVVFGDYYL